MSVSISGSIFSMTGEAVGQATITISATDPGQLSAEATVTVAVVQGNRAPRTEGTMDDYDMERGESVTVDVSEYFTDPDEDELTFSASSDKETVATVEMSGSMLTINAIGSGWAKLTVTAADPDGASADQSPEVAVSELVFSEYFEVGVCCIPVVGETVDVEVLSLIHISEPTRPY